MISHLTKDFLGERQSRAIGAVFLSIGILFGTWATFIPYVKELYQLNDADLGLYLLSMPLGALTANVAGAWLVARIGMRTTTIAGVIGMALAFSIPLNINNVYFLPLGLYLCGAGISVTNIASNMGVTAVESDKKVNIMSTCHGMFSIGLMISSIFASLAQGFGIIPGFYMIAVSCLIILMAFSIRPTIFRIQEEPEDEEIANGAKFILPKGPFLIMILIGICGNITEGTMADWTSVFMRDIVQTNSYFVGWGLAGYSLFMALGRLFGDKVIPALGRNKTLIYGGLLSALGLSVALLFPYTWSSILGFAMVGAGVSCNSPILYGASARIPGISKGTGLAVLNTFAMVGFMAGPVLIGFVSEATSLPIAFMLVLGLALVWAVMSLRVKLF